MKGGDGCKVTLFRIKNVYDGFVKAVYDVKEGTVWPVRTKRLLPKRPKAATIEFTKPWSLAQMKMRCNPPRA